MREIKFRAWDKEYKEMIDWDEIENGDKDGYLCFLNLIKDKRYISMQYTGLHDKNGKEIYEGDIVLKRFWDRPYSKSAKSRQIKCEVYWNCCETGFAHADWNIKELESLGNLRGHDGGPLFMVEVIGNIYENPELIK